jgi:hypothetical protein
MFCCCKFRQQHKLSHSRRLCSGNMLPCLNFQHARICFNGIRWSGACVLEVRCFELGAAVHALLPPPHYMGWRPSAGRYSSFRVSQYGTVCCRQ